MHDAVVEAAFPNLAGSGYRITSPSDPKYNCIAWAAGDAQNWWEPLADMGYFWPAGIPLVYTLESYIHAYETLGYSACETDALETGFEKVALFAIDFVPTHAARQMPSGTWTSKLGQAYDIEHDSLHGLEGQQYGRVVQIMRRALKSPAP